MSKAGPTIVLIGGEMTLESGATLDSRQPLEADEWDVVLRAALGTAEAWWVLAKELVDVVLAQHARTDAWALAWVDKTLKRPRSDGTFTRVRPSSFLGAGNLIKAGKEAGADTFRSDAVNSRYRLLPYMLRFDDLMESPAPAVIIGGFHTTYDDGTDIVGDRPIDYFAARWPDAVIVLPHTPIVEQKVRRILRRPPTTRVQIKNLASQTHPSEARRYTECVERMSDLRRADPLVVSHDFHVSFWADEGVTRDPVDLDAALTFVKSRYDLNLGLWDLARDPVLRATLLQREELSQPVTGPAAVPSELAAQSAEKATNRQQAETTELDGRRRLHEAIWPTLSRLGWQLPPWEKERFKYRLPVGPAVPSLYSEGQESPSLTLSLGIHKRQAVLSLLEIARSGRSEEFLRNHSDLIESITAVPPDPARQAVWRIPGKGWAASPEDWPLRLAVLEHLTEELVTRLRSEGEAAASAHMERLKSMTVELTVDVGPDGAKTVKKRSFWDRLTKKDRP